MCICARLGHGSERLNVVTGRSISGNGVKFFVLGRLAVIIVLLEDEGSQISSPALREYHVALQETTTSDNGLGSFQFFNCNKSYYMGIAAAASRKCSFRGRWFMAP